MWREKEITDSDFMTGDLLHVILSFELYYENVTAFDVSY